MPQTQLPGRQVKDGSVQRADLDVSTVGSAVIAKAIAGSGISLSATGADAGTGDVTIGLGSAGTVRGLLGLATSDSVAFAGVTSSNGLTLYHASQASIQFKSAAQGAGWIVGRSLFGANLNDLFFYDNVNSQTRMVLGATGGVYIGNTAGVTDPGAGNLYVTGTATFGSIVITNTGSDNWNNYNGGAAYATGFRLQESGTDKIYVFRGGSSYGSWGGNNSLNFLNVDNGPVVFFQGLAQTMRLDTDGNLYFVDGVNRLMLGYQSSVSNNVDYGQVFTDSTDGTLHISPRTSIASTVKLYACSGVAAVLGMTLSHLRATMALPIQMKNYTVATLPTGSAGDRAYVTDSVAAPAFRSTATGGGSTKVPVFYDGTNWVVG